MAEPLEVAADEVEAFAQAARQEIDAHLKEHEGECPEFWDIVARLYARGPTSDEQPSCVASHRAAGPVARR